MKISQDEKILITQTIWENINCEYNQAKTTAQKIFNILEGNI